MSEPKLEVIPRDMTVAGRRRTVESDTTLVPAKSLEALAATARHEHDLVINAGRKMIEHAVLCGDALHEAKLRVGRGGWLRWLSENFAFSISTAQFYMRASLYADVLRDNKVETLNAAKVFLVEHQLLLDGQARLSQEQSSQIRDLYKGGVKGPEISRMLGIPYATVKNHIADPLIGKRRLGASKWRRRQGRRAPTAGLAITDDLIEGAAIKLREIFGSGNGRVTDADRDVAVEVLRAALTYEGPVPGETTDVASN